LSTVLSTNGTMLRDRAAEICPWLDWIGIPLDADTSDANRTMRVGRTDHFEVTLENLVFMRSNYPRVGIKLGTVVAALNKDHVPCIPRILPADGMPNLWKIYQVAYFEYAGENRSLLELSDDEFEVIIAKARVEAARVDLPLVAAPRSATSDHHLFMTPNADAAVATGNEYRAIGNFLADFEGVKREWSRYVDSVAIEDNFDTTYPRSERTKLRS